MIELALQAVRDGYHIFPCYPGAKRPIPTDGFLSATNNEEKVREWWDANPDANIGCVPGKSGLIVVDVDGDDGEEQAVEFGLDTPPTRCSTTGKGRHLWYAHPGGANIGNRKPSPCIDIRADAGYVLFPGSLHPSGARYEWRLDASQKPDPVRPLPAPFLSILRGNNAILGASRGTPVTFMGANKVQAGGRHAALVQVAGRFFRKDFGADEVYGYLSAYNMAQCVPPKPDYEVRSIVEDIGRKELARRAILIPEQFGEGESNLRVEMSDWVKQAERFQKPIKAIPTPFPIWNAACRKEGGGIGLAAGWNVIIAGKSGHGKTTLVSNIAVHAALQGKKVGFLSLEQSRSQLMSNMLPMGTGIDASLLEPSPGVYNHRMIEEAEKFHQALDKVGGGLFIADRPRSELKNVMAILEQMRKEGCELFVIDYLQKISVKGEDERMTLVKASGEIQGFAFGEQVTTLVLSQFGRETSKLNLAPQNEGLMGSSAIENDADQILAIDHSRYHENGGGVDTVLLLGKNRHGPVKKYDGIPVRYNFTDLKFMERSI